MTVGGNTAYAGITDLPPLVRAAIEVASSQGFDHSCAPEQGRLLAVLARGRTGQRIGETGTGCGVGLAWMIDATDESTSFVRVDLLVLDGGGKGKEPDDDPPLDPAAGWLALGGTIVLDDFTPSGQPGAPAHDPARRYWLEHPALQATELRLSPTL